MWPPSHSVMQAVMVFRSLCPMKDNLSRCGWPPYIINFSAEAFIYTIRTGRDSILMAVGHMLFFNLITFVTDNFLSSAEFLQQDVE